MGHSYRIESGYFVDKTDLEYKGPFSSCLRIYWPDEAALDGSWAAPKMQPAK